MPTIVKSIFFPFLFTCIAYCFLISHNYHYLEQTELLIKFLALCSLPTGPSFCNKPVLRSVVPPECPTHYQLGERCLVRAIRRARVGNTIPTNRKPNLKLHVIASEFVRQIQNKRKGELKETVPKTEKQD